MVIMKKRSVIYLDNAATTPIDPKILASIRDNEQIYANASSLHYLGRYSKELLENARLRVAKIVQAQVSEIIFTSSGTEADNLALLGLARANKKNGNEIIISTIEHKAIIEATKKLQAEGFVVHQVPVDKQGIVKIDVLNKLQNKNTILVSLIYANNEIGVIQPIKKIAQVIKQNNQNTIFHIDACQAANYLDLSVKNLNVDAMTLSSSKIYAPKGVGCLYVKGKYKLESQLIGGDQEGGRRAGTENLSAILSFATALELTQKIKNKEVIRLTKLQKYFVDKIKKTIPRTSFNGSLSKRLPNNINISFAGAEGESLLLMLDEMGICCSTGSACSAQDLNPSHVLLAVGTPLELAHCSLRFSLGRFTTKQEIDYTCKCLVEVVKKIRNYSLI